MKLRGVLFALAVIAPSIASFSTAWAAEPATPPPAASLKDLIVQTVQACRNEQEGKALLFVSAQALGYRGGYTFGFFQQAEGQSVKLDIQKDGCRLSLIASPKPFGETLGALVAQAQGWTPPLKVLDQHKPVKQADGDSLRTFAGWQSDDRKHSEVLIIDEPDPASKTSRAGYVIAYGRFEQ